MQSSPNRTQLARILIVDNNELGISARKRVLTDQGYEVTSSLSPAKAIELCRSQNFDLILTDHRLPDIDGLKFIKQLREECPAVRIVLLSGVSDALGFNEQETGADAVIQKSSNEVMHLVRSVNRLLRKPVKKPPSREASARKVARKSLK